MSQAVSRPTAAIRIFAQKRIQRWRSLASGARAARPEKEYQREARRTSIVQFYIYNRLHWQEQARQLGRPGTERSLRRPVHQPRASRQVCETIVELSREIELHMGGKLPFPAAGTRRAA